jgi:hypothetical protein
MSDKVGTQFRYLTIHPSTYEAELQAEKRCGYLCIPLRIESDEAPPIHDVVLYEILYPRFAARSRVKACLGHPDAVTAGVAILIWQGIVQGAAWDAIKVALSAFVTSLPSLTIGEDGESAFHFKLSAGLMTPKGRYGFFLELKKAAKKRTPAKRQSVLDGSLCQPELPPAKSLDRIEN